VATAGRLAIRRPTLAGQVLLARKLQPPPVPMSFRLHPLVVALQVTGSGQSARRRAMTQDADGSARQAPPRASMPSPVHG
jgi:hypothetical protein